MRNEAASPIQVASVPADHPYIRHIGLPGDRVERLQDQRAPGQRGWWPPRMLEPKWVEANAGRFDVFHIQFGFDGRHPDQLRELCELLRARGKPLVLTVHDLRNPNHETRALHDRQLGVLVEAADALATLTDCAREQIARGFGREAEVIPHPHVVPLEQLPDQGVPSGRAGEEVVVGVHLKSLRPNMVGVGLLEALAPLPARAGLRLRIDIHAEIWDPQEPGFRADLRCGLEHLQRTGVVDLRVHPYFDDAGLYEYLGEIDVAVLPYKFGTHSGWLEACRDLGVAVVAPDCGCYASQGPVFAFGCDERACPDAGSLREAVSSAREAVIAGTVRPLGRDYRERQRRSIALAHRRLYERLLDGQARHARGPAVAAAR